MWFTKLSLSLCNLVLPILNSSVLLLWIPVYGKCWSVLFSINPLSISLFEETVYLRFLPMLEYLICHSLYRWNLISCSTITLSHTLIYKYINCYVKIQSESCFQVELWSVIAWWIIPLCYSGNTTQLGSSGTESNNLTELHEGWTEHHLWPH